MEKLEVRLLEESLRWALWVGAVGDDHIKGVLVVLQKLEAITNMDLHVRVVEANAHAWKVLLAKTNDCLVNVTQDCLFNALVFDHLSEDTAVTSANDEHLLWVWVREHAQVGDHLLVGELIALGALNDVVEDEDHAVVGALEDEHILILALLVVDDLVDLEGHGLAWPHVADLAEPSILDGGVGNLSHGEELVVRVLYLVVW